MCTICRLLHVENIETIQCKPPTGINHIPIIIIIIIVVSCLTNNSSNIRSNGDLIIFQSINLNNTNSPNGDLIIFQSINPFSRVQHAVLLAHEKKKLNYVRKFLTFSNSWSISLILPYSCWQTLKKWLSSIIYL